MAKGMSEEEAKALGFFILLGIITIGIIILTIKIAIIHFYQKMFWITLILSPVLLLLSIIFLICGILKKEDGQDWGFYQEPEFFDRGMIFIFSGGIFILFFISLILIPYSYQRGYSDEALQKLAEYESQLESLQQIQNILTGQIIWDVQNQVIEETITNMCKDPNYPCDQVKQSYLIYKDIKGAKDDADQIVSFLGFVDKANKNLNNKENPASVSS